MRVEWVVGGEKSRQSTPIHPCVHTIPPAPLSTGASQAQPAGVNTGVNTRIAATKQAPDMSSEDCLSSWRSNPRASKLIRLSLAARRRAVMRHRLRTEASTHAAQQDATQILARRMALMLLREALRTAPVLHAMSHSNTHSKLARCACWGMLVVGRQDATQILWRHHFPAILSCRRRRIRRGRG